ncbi:MAG: ABC transporter permease [Opitutaceae bacterium]|nr:ABC transporter permease [Verrucomicrobiales bacterium]
MNLVNVIATGLREIWSHKFRSLLTMLGIILGVSSLVAMSAMVKGMELGLKEALAAMGGLEKIYVESQLELPIHQRHLQDRVNGVTMPDIEALRQSAPLVHTVTPSVEVFGRGSRTVLGYKDKTARPFSFAGTWPGTLELNEHVVEHGRMFSEFDDEMARSVCVIGTGIRDQLFGDPDLTGEEIVPVGETIMINRQPFTIIGMFQHYESEEARTERLARIEELKKRGGPQRDDNPWARAKGGHFAFRLKNNTVYIPLNTMLLNFRSGTNAVSSANARLSSLQMKVHDIEHLEPALQQVRNVLMMTHNGLEDFAFRTQEDWASQITTTIRDARMSGGIIAAISLIVGGIGIANIMLASISQRVREIGIRKSIGATTGDIFVQILVESIVLAMLGGFAGLAVSIGLTQLVGKYAPSDNAPVITASAMSLAFAASVAIGVLAGMWPAMKAARLHPIQALKYD